jgi:hypothetical protein
MSIFLRAKHWQIFLLLFVIPFILQTVMMGILFSNLIRNPNPALVFDYLKFFPLIMILVMGTLFSWFWAVAINLQKLVPADVKMKVTKFKVFFFIPIVYLLLIVTAVPIIASSQFTNFKDPSPIFFVFAFIIPLHLFCMFCIFYCLYFVAKTFKTVELQREVTFSDFTGEFFLIWFFFIGVWIIQPKINKLVEPPVNTI